MSFSLGGPQQTTADAIGWLFGTTQESQAHPPKDTSARRGFSHLLPLPQADLERQPERLPTSDLGRAREGPESSAASAIKAKCVEIF